MGCPHGREDRPADRDTRPPRAAGRVPRRLGRGAHHRSGRAVPGRRGAGRIFANQVRLSGKVPQVCCLFGPSAAGGAYIPAFCDVVFMVEGNAPMYLGSPRMAEVVIGEHVSLEEMGGARMHATVSGCGDNLVADDAAAHRRGEAVAVVPADELARRRRRSRPSSPVPVEATSVTSSRPRSGAPTTCTESSTRLVDEDCSSRSSRCAPKS